LEFQTGAGERCNRIHLRRTTFYTSRSPKVSKDLRKQKLYKPFYRTRVKETTLREEEGGVIQTKHRKKK